MTHSSNSKQIMAKNIQHYMDKKSISRKNLADDLNISYTTLSSWLQADSYPRIDKIELLAKYFGISASSLIEDSENNKKSQLQTIDLKEEPKVIAYGGKPISKEDMEIIKAILERHLNGGD